MQYRTLGRTGVQVSSLVLGAMNLGAVGQTTQDEAAGIVDAALEAGINLIDTADFYSAVGYCAEESVGYLMKRIMWSIVYQADKRLDVHGLTSAQWGPLMRLQTSGGSTVAELARSLAARSCRRSSCLRWCSTRSGRASATVTSASRCRSSCPPTWRWPRACATRSLPVTCSTFSSASRCCWPPASCC